jgi:hypothetical protein
MSHNSRAIVILSIDSDQSALVWIAYEGTDEMAFVSRCSIVGL